MAGIYGVPAIVKLLINIIEIIAIIFCLAAYVSFFFFLNRFKGFGGGGGPPGGGATCDAVGLFLVVSGALLFAVSFLCFLNGLIFLKSSSGGGGGGGRVGSALCAN